MVITKLGKDDIEFLVDTGAAYLVLNTCEGKPSHNTVRTVGVTGVSETRPFLHPLKFKLGKHWVTHQFLYMPNSSKPLLRRNLLEKLEAYNQAMFSNSNMCICNVAIIKGCDFGYKEPVFTSQLLSETILCIVMKPQPPSIWIYHL